jgi:type VI secretion system secreted protein VgrG
MVPVAMTLSGKTYYYVTDHQGRPIHLIDGGGKVVWSARYTAYGSASVLVELVSNNFRAPGQHFDPETGLHYNRFRYYSPELGRYLSRDPLS